MYSVLSHRHHQERLPPRLKRNMRQARARPAKLRCSELVTLLALPALVFLGSGATVQAQEIARPILSTGLRVQTPATEKLRQPAPTGSSVHAANLPPIESIRAGSDIRPFLDPGVPADLTRAALRRAWSTDPVIRDFIGLSENSWDFNAQDAVLGFGSPSTDSPGQRLAERAGEVKTLDIERRVPIPTVETVQAPSSAQVK